MERLLGNYADAEKHLRECKNIQGMTSRIQLEWVLLRALQGELTNLETKLWEQTKKEDANAALIWETLALGYLREFRFQGAAHCLDKLLEQDPDNLRALDWRSWVYEQLGNKEGLPEDCQRALRLCPQLWKVRLRLAWFYVAEKDPQAASEHIHILQQTRPDDFDFRLLLARWQILQGQTTEARQTLDALLADHPDNASIGIVLSYLGKLETDPIQAERFFRRALKKDHLLQEALYGLILCLERQKQSQEAKQLRARYEKNEKDYRRLKGSFESLEKFVSPENLIQIGEIYSEMELPDHARKFFLKVLQLDPRNRRALEQIDFLEKQVSVKERKKSPE
jgi:Tfp pilus assembly protein PilF